jgi:hypothetical protein
MPLPAVQVLGSDSLKIIWLKELGEESVSTHIRGWSTNPREVLHRIRHFRRLCSKATNRDGQLEQHATIEEA